MKKKIIISTLKGSIFVFILTFILVFFFIMFCGPGRSMQPGSAPQKCECITFKETLDYFPIIILFSLGMSIFSFIIMYPRNLQEDKKLAELKRKEEDEDSSEASEKEKTNTIKK